jgi:CheY-like chemotaxis protein
VRTRIASEIHSVRILIVDDNCDAAEMMGDILRSEGHEVAIATDGAAGFAQFQQFGPELAILDLGLPEIDGYALARRVRAQPRFSTTPLIALSGYTQAEDIARSREAGFTHHLAKPADWKRLEAIISSAAQG